MSDDNIREMPRMVLLSDAEERELFKGFLERSRSQRNEPKEARAKTARDTDLKKFLLLTKSLKRGRGQKAPVLEMRKKSE